MEAWRRVRYAVGASSTCRMNVNGQSKKYFSAAFQTDRRLQRCQEGQCGICEHATLFWSGTFFPAKFQLLLLDCSSATPAEYSDLR